MKADLNPDETKVMGDMRTEQADLLKINERVQDKILKAQLMAEQQVKLKRLIKRNKKVERSIRKRLLRQGMDVNF